MWDSVGQGTVLCPGATLLLAAYDAAGRQAEVFSASVAGTADRSFTLSEPAAYVKAFLLKDDRPLCESRRS